MLEWKALQQPAVALTSGRHEGVSVHIRRVGYVGLAAVALVADYALRVLSSQDRQMGL